MKKRKQPRHTNAFHQTPMAPRFSSSLPFRTGRVSLALSVPLIVSVVVLLGISSATWFRLSDSLHQSPQIYSVEVIKEYPHDPRAFTQGLLYGGNDTFFESTGINGKSSVRKVALQTGKVKALHKMDYKHFGEGLTLLGERLYQVAWMTKTGFIYDKNNLTEVMEFTHQMTDGWGLATDGVILFGTDGTSTLYKIDPQTMNVIEKHIVRYNGLEVHNLNELEFIKGEVWANVWQTDCIARISQKDGSVLGWVILPQLREGLLRAGKRDIDVLNGIAWDADKDRLFVTGKLWPKLYEIKAHPMAEEHGMDIEQLCIRMPFKF